MSRLGFDELEYRCRIHSLYAVPPISGYVSDHRIHFQAAVDLASNEHVAVVDLPDPQSLADLGFRQPPADPRQSFHIFTDVQVAVRAMTTGAGGLTDDLAGLPELHEPGKLRPGQNLARHYAAHHSFLIDEKSRGCRIFQESPAFGSIAC